MDDFLDDEQQGGSAFNPMEILRLFLRRKWLFVVPFVLCLGMAYVAIKTMQPVYQSSGEIRVLRNESASRTIQEGVPRYTRSRHAERETETLIRTTITSPKFLQGVVRDLNLHHHESLMTEGPVPAVLSPEQDQAHIAATARQIEKMIHVRSSDAFIYRVSVRHTDPDLVYLLVNEVVHRFLAEEQASRLEKGETERDFLSDQRELYEQNLRDAQNRLAEFQRSMANSSLVGNPVNEGNLARANDVLARLRSQIQNDRQNKMPAQRREATAVLPAVDQFLRDLKAEPSVRNLTDELTEMETDLAVSQFAEENHGRDQTLLGSTRVALDDLLGRRTEEEYGQMSLMARSTVARYLYDSLYLDVLQGVVERIDGYVIDYRRFMTRQPEQSATLSRLLREVQSAQDMLSTLEQDIRRQNLSLAANMSAIGYQMEIYDEPRRPLGPVEPDKKKLGMMGAALALAIGVGLVLLAELLDRSFKTVPQIEKSLGVTVIGTLPKIKDGPFEAYRRRRIVRWILMILGVLALAAVGFLWVYPKLTS